MLKCCKDFTACMKILKSMNTTCSHFATKPLLKHHFLSCLRSTYILVSFQTVLFTQTIFSTLLN